jgi:predicted PurR-regulated permease PerM
MPVKPRIIGKATGLDPVYVIFSIIVMGGFFGIVGTVIGVPIFVIILKAVRKLIALAQKEENNEKTS